MNGVFNAIRQTSVFDADEADMINRWVDDRKAHIPRSEMLKIVDFYIAAVGPDFKDVCQGIKNKIWLMSDEEWNECANRIPFEVPYSADDITDDEESLWGDGDE